MKRTVSFIGKECTIVNNALLPRKYRHQFGRDLIVDMQKMADSYKSNPDAVNTDVLENITWLMLKEGGEDVGGTVDEWLASLDDTFAIYEIIEDVLGLWVNGRVTTSAVKKK